MLKISTDAIRIAGLEFDAFTIDADDVQKVLMFGDNGAGKSLLLKMLSLNQYEPYSTISINNHKITSESIAYISRLDFVEKFNANRINTIMALKHENWDEHYYFQLLQLFEVDKKTPIKKLSLGKKQRIEIAAGLAQKASLLLIDEAFEGMDDISRIQIMKCIDKYLLENNACLILVTHSTFGLGENFDLIVQMHHGKFSLSKDIETFKQDMISKISYPTDQSLDTLLSIYKDAWVLERGGKS